MNTLLAMLLGPLDSSNGAPYSTPTVTGGYNRLPLYKDKVASPPGTTIPKV
ncbi:hypothetical protein L195_g050590 [Trifolium pratense]|uniref:Uncharacterized protein n=1 Tax=Trifolium pratense TaxID=57577 RepID=A0A2K3JUV0_TRIPR|nr:hypothetical protein L195_g050590 [Trifolium pratense]